MLDDEQPDGLFAPEDQQIFTTFSKSIAWQRLMDVLVIFRGEAFTKLGNATTATEAMKQTGAIDVIQQLLHTFPMRMVEYRRFKRAEVHKRSPGAESPGDERVYTPE